MSTAASRVAHMVYFRLKDSNQDAIEQMVQACQDYLKGHPGTESFAVGTLISDLTRDVNDRDFHVSLHLVFEDRASHDTYQQSARHVQFIEENKDKWAQVRVFDSYI